MAYIFQHTRLGFCWLDLIALAILVTVVVVYIVENRKMKNQVKELQDKLSSMYAVDAVEAENKNK